MFQLRRPSLTRRRKSLDKKHKSKSNVSSLGGSKIAFLYAPVGWQRVDMGRALYESESVFRKIVDDVAVDLNPHLPMDLRDVLFKADALGIGDLINTAHFAQPALFAVEVALDALWRSRGIIPDVAIGHSIGEFAAACSGNGGLPLLQYNATFGQSVPEVHDDFEEEDYAYRSRAITKLKLQRARSGPLTRREAARCVLARSKLMADITSTGFMMAVRESLQACNEAIDAAKKNGAKGIAAIGAVNTPESTVISGDYSTVARVIRELEAKAISRNLKKSKARKVRTTHADHCILMQSLAVDLASRADEEFKLANEQLSNLNIDANADIITDGDLKHLLLFSTVTGKLASPRDLRTGDYWSRHATGVVNFVDAFKNVLSDVAPQVFIELGEGMLIGFARETIEFDYNISATDFKWTPSLAAKNGDDAIVFSGGLRDVNLWLSSDIGKKSDVSTTGGTTRLIPQSPTISSKFVHCKFQPPPHILNQNPIAMQTEVSDSTFVMTMPADASCKHFIAFAELQYGMKLDIYDAVGIGDPTCKAIRPMESEVDLDNALSLAARRNLKAAYFVVRAAGLDGKKRPLKPRHSLKPSSSDKTPELSPYKPEIGRRTLTRFTHEEHDPYQNDVGLSKIELDARRNLLASLPKASTLPETEFPSDAMGGRCLDKWGYRWGQRSGDVWIYVALPMHVKASDISVTFHTTSLEVVILGTKLHEGSLWNVEESCGIKSDTAAWVIVEQGDVKVLHIEMYKNNSGWWKAVWEGHPQIEPWEIPYWKENTFNDGYHRMTKVMS